MGRAAQKKALDRAVAVEVENGITRIHGVRSPEVARLGDMPPRFWNERAMTYWAVLRVPTSLIPRMMAAVRDCGVDVWWPNQRRAIKGGIVAKAVLPGCLMVRLNDASDRETASAEAFEVLREVQAADESLADCGVGQIVTDQEVRTFRQALAGQVRAMPMSYPTWKVGQQCRCTGGPFTGCIIFVESQEGGIVTTTECVAFLGAQRRVRVLATDLEALGS